MWPYWAAIVTTLILFIRPWSLRKDTKTTKNARHSSEYECQCGSCENHL